MATTAAPKGVIEVIRFLDLPAELRKMVYDELLITETPLNFVYGIRIRKVKSPLNSAIVRVCKLVHAEATPILYGGNTIEAFDDLSYIIQKIGNSLSFVRTVIITKAYTLEKLKKNFTLLKGAQDLSSLTLGEGAWGRYQRPETLAKAIGPLARLMHRNQLKETDKKARDVLDGLHLLPKSADDYQRKHRPELQAQYDIEGAKFEREVKELLRATLK